MAETIDPEFDWVTARHQCSAKAMLEKLREHVKASTAQYNKLENSDRYEFTESEGIGAYKFTVFDKKGRNRRAVDFSWTGEVIEIDGPAGKMRVSFGLDDAGVCRFRMDADYLDVWQIGRRALEPLFFG